MDAGDIGTAEEEEVVMAVDAVVPLPDALAGVGDDVLSAIVEFCCVPSWA